jgi:hypothetical protein
LEDNVFKDGFKDIHKLLSRPRFPPGVDYLPLDFKPEREEDPAFKLSYDIYRECFQKIVLAAGYRDPTRPYALRVGAGNRFDSD